MKKVYRQLKIKPRSRYFGNSNFESLGRKPSKNLPGLAKKVLEKIPVRKKVLIPKSMMMEIQSRFFASNRLLTNEFDDIREDDFLPNLSDCDEVGNLEQLHIQDYLRVPLIEVFKYLSELEQERVKLKERIANDQNDLRKLRCKLLIEKQRYDQLNKKYKA